MSKGDIWILIGLIILVLALSSLVPPFFGIFGILFILIGLYMIFAPQNNSNSEDGVGYNQDISAENEEIKPDKAVKTPLSSNRPSEVHVIEIKTELKEEKRMETMDEALTKKELEEEAEPENTNDQESGYKETEREEIASSGEVINNIQEGMNRPPRKDLALIITGILFLIIGFLLSKVPSISTMFSYLGILLIATGLFLVLRKILRREQVIDNWSILIEKANGKADEVFILTEAFIKGSKAPSVKVKQSQMSPGIIRGMLGTSRDFLICTDKSYRLSPYQIFINARDYGENLDISWYLTYRLPIWRALLRFIPGIGAASFTLESLDLFDHQDLTAYATVCHHSTLKAVGNLMLALDQDPSKIDRKSKGFLGIS